MQDQQQTLVAPSTQSIVVDTIDEVGLFESIENLATMSTLFEAVDKEDLVENDEADESDVTVSTYVVSRHHLRQEQDNLIFKDKNIVVHLMMDGPVVQDDEGLLFPNGVRYDSTLRILSIQKNQLQIPADCELGISDFEVGIILAGCEEPVIVSFSSGAAQIKLGPTSIQWMDATKGYLDEHAILAFDLAGDVAVMNLRDRSVKCGPYRVSYNPIDLPLLMGGRGLQFGDIMSFDFQRGVMKLGKNAFKIPGQSRLTITEDSVEILVNEQKAPQRLQFINIADKVQLSSGGSHLLMSPRTHAVVDNQGHVAFDLDHQRVKVQLAQAHVQSDEIAVQFEKGTTIEIVRGLLKFGQGLSLNGRKRLLRYGESRVSLPKKANITMGGDRLKLSVKKKEITMRPYNKQIFIRVGGKLIVLTVTVGIAVDQNGNLAFDYKGNLAIMDTNFMVLDIDGVKFDMSKAKGAVVEMIGTVVIVSAPSQPNNFMELFKKMMADKGLLDLIKNIGEDMSPEELVELLLSMSDPQEILALLQQSGLPIDGQLLERLKELLSSLGGIDALMAQTQEIDGASLLMLKTGSEGDGQLKIGDKLITMPSPLEMTEALSVGGVDVMLARIKGNHVHLLSLK